ncbi:hypothetical protein J6590_069672 [Homalodisca vitripennis]|nr:hypothetical protein J6590_069672 [Homalodisca vitripennis]
MFEEDLQTPHKSTKRFERLRSSSPTMFRFLQTNITQILDAARKRKCHVTLGTPPLEKAQGALTALTVFLPFPDPPSAPIPIPAPRYWTHWRCASVPLFSWPTDRPYSNSSASVLDTSEVCQVNSPSKCRTLSGYTPNSPFQGSKQ